MMKKKGEIVSCRALYNHDLVILTDTNMLSLIIIFNDLTNSTELIPKRGMFALYINILGLQCVVPLGAIRLSPRPAAH